MKALPFWMNARLLALVCLMCLSSAALATSDDNQDARLVGIWSIVEWHDLSAEGEERFTDGVGPVGYFIYSPEGRVFIRVQLNPDVPAIEGRGDIDGIVRAFNNSIDYSGFFAADPESGKLTHRVVTSSVPNRMHKILQRNYRIDGDRLEVFWTEEDGRHFRRVLRKVEDLRKGDQPSTESATN